MAWSMETNEKSIHNTQDQFNSSIKPPCGFNRNTLDYCQGQKLYM